MKIIKGYYPAYYRDNDAIQDAVTLWASVLEDEDFNAVQKGLKDFVKTDTKGFPPAPGQVITRAREIRKMEWEARKREQDQLPEPTTETMPMPDDLKRKLQDWLKGTGI